MSLKWRRLHLSKQGGLPPLLFKYSSTPTGYELYMTDLTNIWTEHINRQDIRKRADEDATTIDPSEDQEQFKVLLQKIGEALHNEPGSSAKLNHGVRSDSLELIVSTKLPAPLRPLKWTLHLSKEPASSAAQHLVLPLVRAEADWESRQRTLIDHLNKKDWVLAKLFDKIESMGFDLSTVFPGISGLRPTRGDTMLSQAAKYIKGVAPFDEQAWLNEVNESSAESGLAANILTELFGSDSAGKYINLNPPPDDWWENLASDTTFMTPPRREEIQDNIEKNPTISDKELDTDTDTASEEDEFERQETPPRLKHAKGTDKMVPPTADNEEETDENSEPEPQSVKKPPPHKAPPAKQQKGLGMIGGKKQPKQKSPPPPSREATHAEPSKKRRTPTPEPNDDETDSGSDLEAPLPPAPTKPKEPVASTAPKSRGLGVIGGKKREKQPVPPPSQTPEPEEPEPVPSASPVSKPTTKRTSTLGMIGCKAPSRSKETSTSQIEAALPPSREENRDTISEGETVKKAPSPSPEIQRPKAEPAQPEKEETEQEKADRKREELKRQLEAKSKAPAKKKRKF